MGELKLPDVEVDGLPVFPCVFLAEPECYYVQEGQDWTRYSERNLKLRLRRSGLSDRLGRGQDITQAEQALHGIQVERRVDYAMPLAGWKAGLMRSGRAKILITESTRPQPAEDVPWPHLKKYLCQLFGSKALPHQIGWWQWARKSIVGDQILPGHCPIYVGPAGAGKSLLQSAVTTKLIGGREASPYSFMVGQTQFNSELFQSEHLIIEDRFHDKGAKKYEFAATIKELTVNHVQRCHKKNSPAITLNPKWRVSMSMNDERENMQVLPNLDNSLLDKLMLFVVRQPDFPTDLRTPEGWKEWSDIMAEELPGLAYHIDNYDLGEIAAPRYGVQPWHDKNLILESVETSKEAVFREIIINDLPSILGEGESTWEGSAVDLERILRGDAMPSKSQTAKVLSWPAACGVLLGKLRTQYPDAVQDELHHRGKRIWKIDLAALEG